MLKKVFITFFASIVAAVTLQTNVNAEVYGFETPSTDTTTESGIQNVTSEFQDQLNAYLESNISEDNLYESSITSSKVSSRKIIVEFKANSLLDNYLTGTTGYKTFSEYATSSKACHYADTLSDNLDTFLNGLKLKGIHYKLNYTYNSVLNGVGITVDSGDIDSISSFSNVKNVMYVEQYDLPEDAVTNQVNVFSTGIYKSDTVSYEGDGVVVGVLDTGLDYTHPAFQTIPSKQTLTYSKIEDTLDKLNASTTTSTLTADDVYLSGKVPFAYDYADLDTDVYPVQSSHGTHVAGIIAGYDESPEWNDSKIHVTEETFTGVAPNAQLAIFKVFSDYETGAGSDALLAALSDACVLGVDILNMSLGSSAGFAREKDEDDTNKIYDKIRETGINLIVSAGNSYSSATGGAYGTNLTSNPDSGTVSSPSTYDASLSVASISGQLTSYFVVNDTLACYFNEAHSASSDSYDFVNELLAKNPSGKFNYVVIGGYGNEFNYTNAKVRTALNAGNCIAVVKRGNISFADKQKIASSYGAVGCIIYNNVSGTISASLGSNYVIPTCTISLDTAHAWGFTEAGQTGTVTINKDYKAGPFMSGFSSWGPSGSLELKPEITAHGGDIVSSVVGGYQIMSGTSMAAPNMAGAVALLRQYVIEYADRFGIDASDAKAVSNLVYQLLMSTATIANNEEGNPYSPRKQGAGIADIAKATSTSSYLWVTGSNKTKLELGDDPNKTGVYTLRFNITNVNGASKKYALNAITQTETVSSDGITVAEKATMLNPSKTVRVTGDAKYDGTYLTVSGNGTAEVVVTITLSKEDKAYLNDNFINGMYVEGFIELIDVDTQNGVNLNIPYMAFYGDWLQAPVFDYSTFEIADSKQDDSVEDEDKLQSSVYETKPIGKYYRASNYYLPLGSYIFNVKDGTDVPYASTDKVAIGNSDYGIYELYAVYAGILRNVKTMEMEITDVLTGEVIFNKTQENVRKSYTSGSSSAIPGFALLELSPYDLGLQNNNQYHVTMKASIDYENGASATRNIYDFYFYVDYEAPSVENYTVTTTYDADDNKTVMLDVWVHDNQYIQSYNIFTTAIINGTEAMYMLQDYLVPVFGERDSITHLSIDITNWMENFANSYTYKNRIGLYMYDYAMNTAAYVLPIDFSHIEGITVVEKDTTNPITNLKIEVGQAYDFDLLLAGTGENLAKDDVTYTINKSNYIKIQDETILGLKPGTVKVTVTSKYDGYVTAEFYVEVVEATQDWNYKLEGIKIDHYNNGAYNTYFSGSRLTLDCGSVITLKTSLEPWYASGVTIHWTSLDENVATINEKGVLTCLNDGVVTIWAEAEGYVYTASLDIVVENQFKTLSGYLYSYNGTGGPSVTNYVVDSYTDLPTENIDETGIYYVLDSKEDDLYTYEKFQYEDSNWVSRGFFTTREDIKYLDSVSKKVLYVPADGGYYYIRHYNENTAGPFYQDTTINTVVIPEGVTTIGAYAFSYSNIETIILPSTLESIGINAFLNCYKLRNVYWITDAKWNSVTKSYDTLSYSTQCTSKNITIGNKAFSTCKALKYFDLSKTTSILSYAFAFCSSLEEIDVRALHFTQGHTFYYCDSIKNVITGPDTVFAASDLTFCKGITSIELYQSAIPASLLWRATNLRSVVFHNDLEFVGSNAFYYCENLTSVTFEGNCKEIKNSAFDSCKSLTSITLPNGLEILGTDAFADCSVLTTVRFSRTTHITSWGHSPFDGSDIIVSFETYGSSKYYSTREVEYNGDVYCFLYSKDRTELVLVPTAYDGEIIYTNEYGDIVERIGENAYAGTHATGEITYKDYTHGVEGHEITERVIDENIITIPSGVKEIGAYSFINTEFTKVIFPDTLEVLGEQAFFTCASLESVIFQSPIKRIERYTFYQDTNLINIEFLEGLEFIGYGAFHSCKSITHLELPATLKTLDKFAFAMNRSLVNVTFAEDSQLEYIGQGAFLQCYSLASIDLPSTVSFLGRRAFSYCTSLKEITIPSGVREMEDYVFEFCRALSKVVFAEGCTATGNYTFAWTNGSAIYFNSALKEVVFPNSLKTIGNYVFLACNQLKEIELPGTEEIGVYAFGGCVNLAKATLGESVSYIGPYAFYKTALTSINLENVQVIDQYAFNSVTTLVTVDLSNLVLLGSLAFYGCTGLKMADMPEVLLIYPEAFMGCTALETVSMPKVKQIGMAAFFNTKLTSVKLPASLFYLGNTVFTNTATLKTIEVEEGNEDYFADEYGAVYHILGNGSYEIVAYPNGNKAGNYEILEGTVKVSDWAFAYSYELTNVILPESLKAVGNYAFYGCGMKYGVMRYEFRSLNAPVLLADYNSKTSSASGLYAMFTYQFGYVAMDVTYPKNGVGYDSYIYKHYFTTPVYSNEIADDNTKAVIGLIDELSSHEATQEDKEAIEKIAKLFSYLSDSQKSLVSNYHNYVERVDAYNALKPAATPTDTPTVDTNTTNKTSQVVAIVLSSVAIIIAGAALAVTVIKPKKEER